MDKKQRSNLDIAMQHKAHIYHSVQLCYFDTMSELTESGENLTDLMTWNSATQTTERLELLLQPQTTPRNIPLKTHLFTTSFF